MISRRIYRSIWQLSNWRQHRFAEDHEFFVKHTMIFRKHTLTHVYKASIKELKSISESINNLASKGQEVF